LSFRSIKNERESFLKKTPSPFSFDLDYCPTDFESADWTDDNEHRDIVEEEYGEEGYNLYFVKTKSRLFVFSQMRRGNGDYKLYDDKKYYNSIPNFILVSK